MAAASRSLSGYSHIDAAPDPANYARRLDEVGATPFWQELKRRTYAMLGLREGGWVLDVGCGTGDDVRALARLVGSRGRAVGLDASATLVAEARRRAKGPGSPAEYWYGDAHHLDFAENTFDGCRAERVLQHLAEPLQAVREMARVTRPEGRLVLVEPDHGTLQIAGASPAITRRIIACRVSHIRHGRIGRHLPGLLRAAGARDIVLTLLTLSNAELAEDLRSGVLEKYASGAEAAGLITPAEHHSWLLELQRAADEGTYRHGLTVFLAVGTKQAAAPEGADSSPDRSGLDTR